MISGRFKSGLDGFKDELQPLSPEELLKLLQSSDYDNVCKLVLSDVYPYSDMSIFKFQIAFTCAAWLVYHSYYIKSINPQTNKHWTNNILKSLYRLSA